MMSLYRKPGEQNAGMSYRDGNGLIGDLDNQTDLC